MRVLVGLLLCSGCTVIYGGAHEGSKTPPDGGTSQSNCECVVPPASTCIDDSTLEVFASQGTCSQGACTYAHWTVTCQDGCVGRACVGNDPCAGVECLSPPQNVCTGEVLETYASAGTCDNGSCSYAVSETTCAEGCSNGACSGNPCAGVLCNTPPDTTCTNESTLRTFASAGTCSNGSCSYTSYDTVCANAPTNGSARCENAACSFVCNAGYVASGNQCVVASTTGLTWTAQTSGVTSALFALWSADANNLYIGGDSGVLLQTNDGGSTWTTATTGITGSITALWGTSTSNVWACNGSGGALHNTGSGWVASTAANSTFWSMWGSSANDLYGVGVADGAYHSTDGGSTWNLIGTSTEYGYNVWGSGPNDVYLSVLDADSTELDVDRTTDGSTLAGVALAGTSVQSSFSIGMWGPSAGHVYVTANTDIFYSADSGATWTQQTTATASLNAIVGSSPTDIYAVGSGGLLLHSSDGTSWTSESSGTTNDLYGVWYASGQYWLVGDAGTILHASN